MVMVTKKKRNPHNIVFLEALIMALFIFGLGILLGFVIEGNRATSIQASYFDSQVNLVDIQTLSTLIGDGDYSCAYRIEKNTEFGNRIYEDALILAEYEESQTFGRGLKEQHRIYDLLRTIFWINSIELKEDCPDLNTIVYLYEYGVEDKEEVQEQDVFSRFAGELKDELGENTVLIPIAINLDLASLDILKERYGVDGTMILINEDIRLKDIESLESFDESNI
ncbi:hypothetical protein CMI41_02490 [Candidatus Pacearchaeota archaeon]|nr:hypothetical protein [Candidatus Pacearchaeota archaeon]|tara:strand:- start:9775 stop:10446 length:672 start_codon:yes stop_codon:yes gene_type:complete